VYTRGPRVPNNALDDAVAHTFGGAIMADFVLTPSGKQKIEQELEHLKTVEMPALSERIRQARDLGDLSENFDYQDSKRQQGFIQGRIADLQTMLERSVVVEDDHHAPGTIGLGATVTLRDTDDDTEESYTLVGDYEADPDNNKISVASPLGKQLMGHSSGDSVAITVNGFTTHYTVVSVS